MKDLVVGLILKLWAFLTGFTWEQWGWMLLATVIVCLLYTSDAADEL